MSAYDSVIIANTKSRRGKSINKKEGGKAVTRLKRQFKLSESSRE